MRVLFFLPFCLPHTDLQNGMHSQTECDVFWCSTWSMKLSRDYLNSIHWIHTIHKIERAHKLTFNGIMSFQLLRFSIQNNKRTRNWIVYYAIPCRADPIRSELIWVFSCYFFLVTITIMIFWRKKHNNNVNWIFQIHMEFQGFLSHFLLEPERTIWDVQSYSVVGIRCYC